MDARDKIHNIAAIPAKAMISFAHQNNKRATQGNGYGLYLIVGQSPIVDDVVFHQRHHEGDALLPYESGRQHRHI